MRSVSVLGREYAEHIIYPTLLLGLSGNLSIGSHNVHTGTAYVASFFFKCLRTLGVDGSMIRIRSRRRVAVGNVKRGRRFLRGTRRAMLATRLARAGGRRRATTPNHDSNQPSFEHDTPGT